MKDNIRFLFQLVRAGLYLPERTDLIIPDRIDWPSIYAAASEQGVLTIAWDGLQRLIADGVLPLEVQPPRTLRMQWAYNVERMEQTYARQQKAIGRLSGFYGKHGIRMMILKGYGLSLNYPVPEHRPCGDIDIWLYGRQRQADELLRSTYGTKIDEDKHHHTVFHIDGVMVENHYDFLNIHSHLSNRGIERQLQALATQPGETADVNGNTIYLPPADFNALFLLRHAAAHFAAAEIGLRHVVDWALFVHKYHDKIDWAQLETVAAEQNMHRFLHSLNAMSIDVLGIRSECFPAFERDEALEQRVLNDILHPEFDEQAPQGNIVNGQSWRFRRWWANRWKHRMVYKENLILTFFVQIHSHLLKPKSLT